MTKDQQTPESETLDHHQIDDDDDESILMESFSSRSRCCSFLPCFGSGPSPARTRLGSSSSPSVWERLQTTAETEDTWWSGPLKGLKKIREWSEIIAGPKWKTFIRRFNRNGRSPSTTLKFHYDPLSYSLNFDEGPGQNSHLAEEYFPDFSSRYAAVPLSCKSSMDLGKSGIPSLS